MSDRIRGEGGIGTATTAHAEGPRRGAGTNRLTDRGMRAYLVKARAGEAHTKKLSDGGGLYLTLTPKGTVVWRIKPCRLLGALLADAHAD